MRGLIGEMRSAHARGDKRELARLVLGVRGGEQFEDVLRYARGLDADVLSPDRLVSWAVVTDSHGRTERYEGVLTVCGVEIDVPDMSEVTRRWLTRPGWYVLDVWERDAWVRSDAGVPHRDAPRQCIETIDEYLRGEASDGDVRLARNAADAAVSAASAYASPAYASAAYAADVAPTTYAAYAAVYASASIAYSSANATNVAAYAANAAAYAANVAASCATDTDANHAAAEERQMWHEDWRWHVVWHAIKEVS